MLWWPIDLLSWFPETSGAHRYDISHGDRIKAESFKLTFHSARFENNLYISLDKGISAHQKEKKKKELQWWISMGYESPLCDFTSLLPVLNIKELVTKTEGRIHAGKVHEGLSPMGGSPYWSRGRVGGFLHVGRKEQQGPFWPCPPTPYLPAPLHGRR